jgi:hypothetical protein
MTTSCVTFREDIFLFCLDKTSVVQNVNQIRSYFLKSGNSKSSVEKRKEVFNTLKTVFFNDTRT